MSGYIGTQPVPQATQTRQTFTATASQTSFATGGYQAGYIDVFLNGVKLVDGTDFTATNGSDVVLTTGAASGDTLEVVAYTAFTVADQTFTGDIVMSDGLTVDNDGATVLTVDRATSDGTIIDVQKGGTTVGSIGVVSGDMYITSSASNHSGLRLSATNILPYYNGSLSDNQVDLGQSVGGNYRFKDLYLSGGVYLGGTGAANKLDDYEEGTWTPTFGSITMPNLGRYTKVGNLVTVIFGDMYGIPALSSLGATVMTGLPFAMASPVWSETSTGSIVWADATNGYKFQLAVCRQTAYNEVKIDNLSGTTSLTTDPWTFSMTYITA